MSNDGKYETAVGTGLKEGRVMILTPAKGSVDAVGAT